MKRTVLPTLLASLVAAAAAQAQTSSSTPVIGYYKVDVPAGSTAWCCALVNKKDFQGAATSITAGAASVINVSGTPFAGLTLDNHYVEILTGTRSGLILDITAKTDNSVTVNANLTGVGATETFCIRKHSTITDVFRGGADLVAFIDSVMVVDPTGAQKVYGSDGSQIVEAVNFETPMGDDIIYPGQGFIVTVGGPRTLTFGGNETSYVKTGPTILPAYPGRINLHGIMNPVVDSTPGTAAAANETTPFSALGYGTLRAFQDSVSIFSVDGVFTQTLIGWDGAQYVEAVNFEEPIPGTTPVRNGAAVSVTVSGDSTFTQPQLIP